MANLDDSVPPVPVPPVETKPLTRKPTAAAAETPPAAPAVSPYAAPTATAPQAYVPVPAGPPQGLAIASMVTGLAGLLFSMVLFGFGFLASVAAVVTGHIAQKRQPYAKGFWLTGIITGYVGIALSVLLFVIFLAIIAFAASSPYSNY